MNTLLLLVMAQSTPGRDGYVGFLATFIYIVEHLVYWWGFFFSSTISSMWYSLQNHLLRGLWLISWTIPSIGTTAMWGKTGVTIGGTNSVPTRAIQELTNSTNCHLISISSFHQCELNPYAQCVNLSLQLILGSCIASPSSLSGPWETLSVSVSQDLSGFHLNTCLICIFHSWYGCVWNIFYLN